jgi:hypothetical protein
MRSFFASPVVIWLDLRRPDFGTMPIETIGQGLAALHRYGLGDFRSDEQGRPRPEWSEAAGALVRAKTEPSPGNIERARAALERLARASGSLARPARSYLPALEGWRRFA